MTMAHQKSDELVEAFKDEDLSAWPGYIIHRGEMECLSYLLCCC